MSAPVPDDADLAEFKAWAESHARAIGLHLSAPGSLSARSTDGLARLLIQYSDGNFHISLRRGALGIREVFDADVIEALFTEALKLRGAA